jgi:hypothetical protein
MDISSGDISALVFRRVVRDDLGEFSLDGQMFSVLMELDGKRNLGAIARKTGQDMARLRGVISRLLEHNLIEPVEAAISTLDNDFFQHLSSELSLALGPIADVLIDDAISDLGLTRDRFPSHRAAELIDLLARQIQREQKMAAFTQSMINKIKEKGY